MGFYRVEAWRLAKTPNPKSPGPQTQAKPQDRCMEFDDIFGWEAERKDQKEWWSPLPDDIRDWAIGYGTCALVGS